MNGDNYRPVEWPHRPGIVRPVRRDPSGMRGPTPCQARKGSWQSVYRGWHLPAWLDVSVTEQRIVSASALLPHTTGITGWAALRWAGGYWFDGLSKGVEIPVPIALGAARLTPQDGMTGSQERLGPKDLCFTDGLSCTIPARSALFEARYAPGLSAAVAVIDMAAYNDLVTLDEMAAYALAHPGWTGIPQAREAIALADENSWSPQETRMRLIWQVHASLPRPLTNVPIFDLSGRHIATPDLLDPIAAVCGEYDGVAHLAADRRRQDASRAERLADHGFEVVTMISGDKPALIAQRLRAAYARAKRRPIADRSWTLEAPAAWPSTTTVLKRRAVAGTSSRWLLAHQQHPSYSSVA